MHYYLQENKERVSDSSSFAESGCGGGNNDSLPGDKDKDDDHRPADVAKHHLAAFLKIIEIIRSKEKDEKAKLPYLESRFDVYITDILDILSEIETSIRILPLIDAGSIETLATSSSSSSISLLDSSLADTINIIEQELKPKLDELKSKAQQMLDRLPVERLSTSISFVKEFTEKTLMPTIPILEEILIIVKESLQSPLRATINQENERLLGVTKTLHLEPDTATNITMTFNIRDKLTYVESLLQYSKFQVTKIAGAPTFSEGKTHLSLDPPLKYRYVKGFAEIYGNIAPASHGETVKDGDPWKR